MTIRGLVKKALTENGYQVEISSWSKRKTHVRNLYTKNVKQEGIELVREVHNKYQACMNRDDKVEILMIHTNGHISVEDMQVIVDECKKDYNPYHTETMIYIY